MRRLSLFTVLLVVLSNLLFAGRYYDAATGRFLQIDPLAKKYPSLSPYNYVANIPLKYIDPDGKKIIYAQGASQSFKNNFAASIKHLNKHGQGGLFASLQKSKTVYVMREGASTFYNAKTNTITWNPTMGIYTNEGHALSPTTVLNHEADHANQDDKNPAQMKNDKKTKDSQYGNKEEKRVITGSEQKTAKALGEIGENDVTRKDHEGIPFETTGPTSTEDANPIIVTPEKENE